ncbi:MAG: efflux RND transporter periplasmic adaptor subunit [Proteobacteria bacterium]|nr:efflux RND transporter periplasmic adaptor subunit [Pseudomonadota bacterium]
MRMIIAVVVLLGLGVAGYAYIADESRDAPAYLLATVERGPITAAVSATGTVNAVMLVQVGSEISGQIRELYADYNATVRRGDKLALISPEIFAARVDQARAELASAQANIRAAAVQAERAGADAQNSRAQLVMLRAQTTGAQIAADQAQRELARKIGPGRSEFVAASERERAQADFDHAVAIHAAARAQEAAQAAAIAASEAAIRAAEVQVTVAEANVQQKEAMLRQAEVDLARTRITAPIDGVVVERNVDVGQTVAASLQAPTLFTIAQDLARLQVECYIDETDIGRVALGQTATFTVSAYPGESFPGEVVQIRKAAQVIQNVVTYIVVLSARNETQRLFPGMTATVQIVTDRVADALRVPNAALRFRPLRGEGEGAGAAATPADPAAPAAQVYVMKSGGELRPVAVEPGLSDGRFTQVTSGALAAGDTVIAGYRGPPKAAQRRFLRFRL